MYLSIPVSINFSNDHISTFGSLNRKRITMFLFGITRNKWLFTVKGPGALAVAIFVSISCCAVQPLSRLPQTFPLSKEHAWFA